MKQYSKWRPRNCLTTDQPLVPKKYSNYFLPSPENVLRTKGGNGSSVRVQSWGITRFKAMWKLAPNTKVSMFDIPGSSLKRVKAKKADKWICTPVFYYPKCETFIERAMRTSHSRESCPLFQHITRTRAEMEALPY